MKSRDQYWTRMKEQRERKKPERIKAVAGGRSTYLRREDMR